MDGTTYIAREGRVYVRQDGRLREVNSALTLNDRDVHAFKEALQEAYAQRRANAEQLSSLTGVVQPLDAA